jgi:squalene synthase HpnC
MTTLDAATPRPDAAPSVEAPSGKGRGDENFPVGSWLIRRDLRVHVHAFYRFARNADDIADSPALAADDKLRRLDRMAAILDGVSGGASENESGSESPAASAMRESLAATGVTAQHCHDVLQAFRQDAVKLRYRDWDDLMEYCRYSAAPVGRQLLDLHGESRATWPASDVLCAALQVLNHLQDCAADYRALDRVYLPLADLDAAGCGVVALAAPAASPGLRRVLDTMLDRTDGLIATARGLPPGVAARGLRWESAVIVGLAARLAHRLRRGDPLASRVRLTKGDCAAAFLTGILARRQRCHRR